MRIPTLKDIWGKMRSLGGKRVSKGLGWTLAIALLLFIIIGIPYLFSSQPSFYSRYQNIQTYYDGWKTSTHADVDCVSCHAGSKTTDWLPFRATMIKEYYLKLTANPKELTLFSKPKNKACLVCHSNTRKASPSGDLKIPHKAHVVVLKMKCVSCHEFAVHKKNPEGKHVPRMKDCLTCHDGEKAVNRCDACHTKKDIPDNHRKDDWLIVHENKKEDIDCNKCHGWVKDFCKDCHSRKPTSHAGLWRTNHQHRIENRQNCKTCHQEDFCVKCHGEVPREMI